jgi:hypothetical protein
VCGSVCVCVFVGGPSWAVWWTAEPHLEDVEVDVPVSVAKLLGGRPRMAWHGVSHAHSFITNMRVRQRTDGRGQHMHVHNHQHTARHTHTLIKLLRGSKLKNESSVASRAATRSSGATMLSEDTHMHTPRVSG